MKLIKFTATVELDDRRTRVTREAIERLRENLQHVLDTSVEVDAQAVGLNGVHVQFQRVRTIKS